MTAKTDKPNGKTAASLLGDLLTGSAVGGLASAGYGGYTGYQDNQELVRELGAAANQYRLRSKQVAQPIDQRYRDLNEIMSAAPSSGSAIMSGAMGGALPGIATGAAAGLGVNLLRRLLGGNRRNRRNRRYTER